MLLLCFSTIFLLCGCSNKNENISEGILKIQELNYEEAFSLFDLAESVDENEKLLNRGRGLAYMGLMDYENAANCFVAALQSGDGFVKEVDYDINYYLAAAYTKNNNLAEAKAVYDAILTMRPKAEDAIFLRGNVQLGLGQYEMAVEDFNQVLAMDPQNFDRLIQIYEVLAFYDNKEKGIQYLNEALASYESQMDSYDKGRIYYYLEEYQKAYVALEEAKNSGGADAYLYLGMSYEATKDYNYSSNVYKEYLSKYPTDARIYNQLGLCEIAKEEYQNALDAFQEGLKLGDSTMMQTLQYNEMVAYEYLQDYKKAFVLLESYLKSYPDDENAKREYEFLLTR